MVRGKGWKPDLLRGWEADPDEVANEAMIAE
jgi:hypothetical protein